MDKQYFNPYLPSWEYIPDAEPRVFGDRVYIYGSHDRFNGHAFCLGDYVCYSASVDNIGEWRYEGVIYGRADDPRNVDGDMCLYAPDVVQGVDGRYYLYYVLNALPVVSVAVCDTPSGRYKFFGYVHDKSGNVLGERPGDEAHFDPGVLVEGGKAYLYTGFCMPNNKNRHGAMVTRLSEDMLTAETEPEFIAPSKPYSDGTGYEGHEYFEAASLRKVGNKYYFIYSSVQCHELCYAISDKPDRDFKFMGTIVSNTDRGISTYKPADRPMGWDDNNHGSIANVGGKWYVFYHRHTNGHSYSRQACLEEIHINDDGSITQAEITSCGANGKPLRGMGEYPAYIACNLYCEAQNPVGMTVPGKRRDARFPYITQDGKDGDEINGHIANMDSGATAGYKYFDCQNSVIDSITTRARCDGQFEVMLKPDGDVLGSIRVYESNDWKTWKGCVKLPDGVNAIYLRYVGNGYADLHSFTLSAE